MLNRRVHFGAFEADLHAGELWRGGAPVPIQDLPFRLLAALLERPGELVTRQELTERLWGSDTFVDAAAGLNTAVAKLRDALNDNAENPAFIETVPKRGYRFVGTIEPAAVESGVGESGVLQDFTSAVDAGLEPRTTSRWAAATRWGALAIIVLTVIAVAAYQLRADRGHVRVAVVLFDNETGQPELNRLAQGLTDATVTDLTAEPRLAVIGNAAVLRTARPFRDIAKVRDALNADYIVIGQVQLRDDGTIVRAHLIRAKDQAHVWVDVARLTDAGEAALQSDVAGRIRLAIANHIIR